MWALIQCPWQLGLGQLKNLLHPSELPCPSSGEVCNILFFSKCSS